MSSLPTAEKTAPRAQILIVVNEHDEGDLQIERKTNESKTKQNQKTDTTTTFSIP